MAQFLFLIVALSRLLMMPSYQVTASDIIVAVNALRASQGLAAYQADAGLIAYAQEHSDYQARTGNSTHVHSDGTLSIEHGIVENVAAGDSVAMQPAIIVYQIWSDAGHMKTMTGYTTGSIGVGVASSGNTIYVTLNVRPGETAANSASGSTAGSVQATTAIPLAALLTSTPRPDGSQVHVVGYGEALWSIAIAYGVTINEIRGLNGLPAESTDIYVGQKLLIRPKGSFQPESTATPTPTVSPAAPATRRATRTPHRPTVTASILSTATAGFTQAPTNTLAPKASTDRAGLPPGSFPITPRQILIAGIFLLAGALLVVFFWSFKK